MATKLIISTQCPYCHKPVAPVPDRQLKMNPHEQNVEFVVTKTGRKQYFHTDCWIKMVKETKRKHSN